jgi:serine/threonine-protein kinase HipA
LRISLAGAQEEAALLRHEGRWCIPHGATPTTHILKLPLGRVGAVRADFTTSVENEWLCSRLLSAFGMEVADCAMARFGRHKVLVVERFDRRRFDTWWARLPQEDFCQALGCPPGRKYEAHGGPGVAKILDLLRGSQRPEADRRQFLKAQLLFWLLAAPDGHAKNFSIRLEAGGHFRLAPFYDVMSAWPILGAGPDHFDPRRLKLAMAVTGKSRHTRLSEIHRRHWNEAAKRNALGQDFEPTINEVLAAVPAVIAQVGAQLPPGFPAGVSDPVFHGIESQAARLAAMPPA